MENIKVLVNQLRENLKLKIFDDLVLTKLEESLLKSCENLFMTPPNETQETLLTLTFEIYNLTLEIAKSYLFSSSQPKIYVSRLRQICCEFISLAFEIDQSQNKSTEENDSSYLKVLIMDSPQMLFELIKIIVRSCILLLSDINRFEDAIFRNLSLARMLYTEFLVLPAGSEERLISSVLKSDSDKLKLIGLFYLIDLELSVELPDEIQIEVLTNSFSKVFELSEISGNTLFERSSKSKLLGIYLKAIVKTTRKDGLLASEKILNISLENGSLRGVFKDMEGDRNLFVLKKLMILVKLESGKGFNDLPSDFLDESPQENSIFQLAIQSKLLEKKADSDDFKRNFKKSFSNHLENSEILPEELFPVLEIVKNVNKHQFLSELLALVFPKAKFLSDEIVEGFIVFILGFLEENPAAWTQEALDFIIKGLQSRKLRPKTMLFFMQKLMKFIIAKTFTERDYSKSFEVLEKVLFPLESSIKSIDSLIFREFLYIQLNNAIMLKNRSYSTKLFNNESIRECERTFLQSLIDLKFKLIINSSKNQLITEIKTVLNREDFNFELFFCEIMGFGMDSGQIKIILDVILEVFKGNSKRLFKFINKNGGKLGYFLGFFEPLVEEFAIVADGNKDAFQGRFSQEKVKILVNLMNFMEDFIWETLMNDEGEGILMSSYDESSFFEAVFWNLMILTGNLGLDILFSRKLIQTTLLLKLLPFIDGLKNIDHEMRLTNRKIPLSVTLMSLFSRSRFPRIPSERLNATLQACILLITNHLVTMKTLYKKDKKTPFSEFSFVLDLIESSTKAIEFLLEESNLPPEKLLKAKLFLETNRFELLLLTDPSQCLIILQDKSLISLDPSICVLFSQLASQYSQISISTQSLRAYLKLSLGEEGNKNDSFEPMKTPFLALSAYRELLKETEDQAEFVAYLRQVLIFSDNSGEFNPDELLFILSLTLRKSGSFSKESKNEAKRISTLLFEKLKGALSTYQQEKIEYMLYS